MNAFFRSPSLGGWLAFANMGFWIASFAFSMNSKPTPAVLNTSWFHGIVFVLGMPFLYYSFPACDHEVSAVDALGLIVVFVINAFAWGYGVAFGINRLRRLTTRCNGLAGSVRRDE